MAFVRYAVIVFVFLLCSCNRTSEGKVELHYVIRSIDTIQERMNVTFELINHSSTAFEDASWELHWNQMKGRIIASSLPDGIQYTHINGDNYMKLQFDNRWALRPKDTLIFELQQQGVMDRLAMGPVGVFIAQNDLTRDVETTIIWQKARGLSELEIPTLENRFDRLEGIFLLPKDSILPLVPQPLTLSITENKRRLDTHWSIDLDSNLYTFRPQLISLMNDLFEQGLDFETNAPSNFFIRYNPSLDSEAYRLDIAQEHITLESASYSGLVYGLQSLHQLIDSADLEGSLWPIAQIEDAPRFGYRGFLLDIARNFYGLPKLKQIVDLMSRMKLNHLDLRLTDDEGWRLEIDGLPELTSVASNRGYTTDERDRLIPMYGSGATGTPQSNGYLTALEFEELLSYAQVRNVQIIPQISFPSHARAAVKAMESRYYRYMQLNDPEKAKEFLLTDFEDKSNYRSAQNYNDNIACICLESAYTFYEKVISSVEQNYRNAEVPLTIFSIGADEVPYGAWQESPICATYLKEEDPSSSSISSLYTSNLKRLKNLFDARGITMAGWEDILLDHSEKSQGETQLASETLDFEVIPYVWNTSWGESREDMIYKMANAGFTPIMSNSSAFYFDMSDDKDIENYGLNWSGYVDYYDTWAIDPLNVFSNLTLTEKHGLSSSYIAERVRLDPEKRANFLGIQGQLWTETAFNEDILDELLMPNLIVFSERAWASSPEWHQEADAVMQKKWSFSDWNIFSNTLGQRLLPLISHWYPTLNYHLPKPGAKIIKGKWQVRSYFPGLEVHYNFTDREPTVTDPIYTSAIDSTNAPQLHLRVFASDGRGGRSIQTKSHSSY
jgi:hexosaminidase